MKHIRTHYTALPSCPTDSPTPFFYTSTSLLPNHALITDVQQITGRNGEQLITCTSGSSGRGGAGVRIYSIKNTIIAGTTMSTATIVRSRYPPNGLYFCLKGNARYYISLFLKNSSKYVAMYQYNGLCIFNHNTQPYVCK